MILTFLGDTHMSSIDKHQILALKASKAVVSLCTFAMDTIINIRVDIINNFLNDIYSYEEVNPFACIYDVAQQISDDLTMFRKVAWGAVASRYWDIIIIASLMKRRAQIHDIDGLRWCIHEVEQLQNKVTSPTIPIAW